jgi:hypothetical protein
MTEKSESSGDGEKEATSENGLNPREPSHEAFLNPINHDDDDSVSDENEDLAVEDEELFDSIAPFYMQKQVIPVKKIGHNSLYSDPFEGGVTNPLNDLHVFDFEGLIAVSLSCQKILFIDYDSGYVLNEWNYAEDFSKNQNIQGCRISGWDEH